MTRFLVGDLRTGRNLTDLPVLSGGWQTGVDKAETLSASVDMSAEEVHLLKLRDLATPGKAFIAAVEDDTIVGAGPIWARKYDRDAAKLDLSGLGLWSLFDHRLIIPLLAETLDVTQWTVPDPSDPEKRVANPLLTTQYMGIWWGTMAKRLVQQALSRTGGDLPMVFQPDEIDGDADHVKTYLGVDLKPVGEALKQLTELEGGCEIVFAPRFTSDKLGVEWALQTGTAQQPLLFSQSVPHWHVTVDDSPVSNLVISEDGSDLAVFGWASGGSQGDDVILSRAVDQTLLSRGYPMVEATDTSHSTVSIQSTMDKYANQIVLNGRSSLENWSFTVESRPVDVDGNKAGPWANEYRVGDFCDLTIAPYDPETGAGDPYVKAAGTYRHRIVALSGDQDGEFFKVQTVSEVI